ncbi:VanZ family protein [Botrimarina hoheduenensis]|nr:VanZ family protein [Botrimarina hoheduenensis]
MTNADATQRHAAGRGTQPWRWGIALGLYWALLFTATHIPTPVMAQGVLQLNGDKLIHAGAYFVLATLALGLIRSLGWQTIGGLPARVVVVVAIIAYGVFDEITQPLVNRICDPLDGLADTVGVITAAAIDRWRQGQAPSSAPPANDERT